MFIDIHTHQPGHQGIAIRNVSENYAIPNGVEPVSMGIHPWKIDIAQWEMQLSSLKEYSTVSGVKAIGECGLDKNIPIDLSLQSSIFREQVRWAALLQKPLIIHCVRAWEEVFSLLREEQFDCPVVFHGFNKSAALANRISTLGYYLSFGNALQKESIAAILQHTAADRFLLETDDGPLSISEIYALAAKARGIDMNSLSLQIQKNANAVFGALL